MASLSSRHAPLNSPSSSRLSRHAKRHAPRRPKNGKRVAVSVAVPDAPARTPGQAVESVLEIDTSILDRSDSGGAYPSDAAIYWRMRHRRTRSTKD